MRKTKEHVVEILFSVVKTTVFVAFDDQTKLCPNVSKGVLVLGTSPLY